MLPGHVREGFTRVFQHGFFPSGFPFPPFLLFCSLVSRISCFRFLGKDTAVSLDWSGEASWASVEQS